MLITLTSFGALVALLPAIFVGAVTPHPENPSFYLVATSKDESYNLRSLRIDGVDASLESGVLEKFYIDDGNLLVDGIGFAPTKTAHVSFTFAGRRCTVDGPLIFIQGQTSNKCSEWRTFGNSKYDEPTQLASRLTFGWTGGFYACEGGKVHYSKEGSSKAGCTAITLYTIPAAT